MQVHMDTGYGRPVINVPRPYITRTTVPIAAFKDRLPKLTRTTG